MAPFLFVIEIFIAQWGGGVIISGRTYTSILSNDDNKRSFLMNEVYLTRSGHQKLMEDLEELKSTKRRQLSKAIAEARAHGDISENAEYDAAKEAQGLNEKRS